MRGFKKILNQPFRVFSYLAFKGHFKWMNDEQYLKLLYHSCIGKKLNLEDPQTFNEKLQWLKLYDRKPEYVTYVDKYAVREHIKQTIGEEYLIPLLGVYDNVDEIPWDELPNEFVLKCTHGYGCNIICEDKKNLNIGFATSQLRKWLKTNYYYSSREWVYKNVRPRIICEKFMVDESGIELKDYKFFCFNGIVKLFKIDYDRFNNHRANYYDACNKQILPFGEIVCPPNYDKILKMPQKLDKMIDLAKKLSIGHPFLRVDFYIADKSIYFGEMTFFPASGVGKFTSEEWDYTLGSWIKLT